MASTSTLCLVLCLIVCCKNAVVAVSTSFEVAVVVLSQSNSYHSTRAHLLRQEIYEQAMRLNISEPTVLLSHEQWPDLVGSWAVLPIIPLIVEEFGESKSAILFCEDDVTIDVGRLAKILKKIDFKKDLFLGRALRDNEATIIHHFAFHEDPSSFKYPHFAAGFIISTPLMKRLSERMKTTPSSIDFTIDPQHELALYIWEKGSGVSLTEAEFLCGYTETSGDCAVRRLRKSPDCGSSVGDDEIFFAVKTCEKFHKERVPVLKKTWGQNAKRIEYFSDVEDALIPTTTLGIPNTERGHCAKFLAILRYVYDRLHVTNYKWVVVVDDDTLMSVARLKKLLSCYNPLETVVLGERYGYGVVKGIGYDYITLGGGMVLSQTALRKLIDSDTCHCGADDSPDDMTFGMCLRRLNVGVTHSPLFHQARPVDYAEGYLSNQEPVSFHKHWMVDPFQIYQQWLVNPTTKIESSNSGRSAERRPSDDRLDHREL